VEEKGGCEGGRIKRKNRCREKQVPRETGKRRVV
jgi:hypothetical protein